MKEPVARFKAPLTLEGAETAADLEAEAPATLTRQGR